MLDIAFEKLFIEIIWGLGCSLSSEMILVLFTSSLDCFSPIYKFKIFRTIHMIQSGPKISCARAWFIPNSLLLPES